MPVTTTAAPARRLYRQPGRGAVLGVAWALAEHIGVPVKYVRLTFVALSLAAGFGAVLYGVFFIVLPTVPGQSLPPGARRREGVVALLVALVCIGIVGSSLPQAGLALPIMLAALGGALIWRQASEPERTRLRALSRSSLSAGSAGRLGRVRLLAGAAMVVAGAVLVLARADVTAVRDGLLAVVVTLVGVALVTGPWWMGLVSQLGAEREERVRSQERADIAAHLHDSVLQTLALIQRNADSPREVVRLARGQERDLRGILYDSYGSPGASGQFGDQLRTAAAEVEDAYGVSIEVVVVGDAPLDDGLTAVAAAAREAMVNAAKHSGVGSVSLYAEVEPDVADGAVAVYVKDRGAGFAMDDVADDRQGVRGSIIGRVERHGGTVEVRSSPGSGTEIAIRMPRQTTEGKDER